MERLVNQWDNKTCLPAEDGSQLVVMFVQDRLREMCDQGVNRHKSFIDLGILTKQCNLQQTSTRILLTHPLTSASGTKSA